MNGTVRHQPRVAFDAARVLVGVAAGDAGLFAWYTEQLVALLGPSGRRDLSATRKELTTSSRENTRDVEGASGGPVSRTCCAPGRRSPRACTS
ncbi:hypothetical protein ACFQZ4_01975 [Catellatospora coxensis]